jgi:capsular polysaccharide biosynthesis protein
MNETIITIILSFCTSIIVSVVLIFIESKSLDKKIKRDIETLELIKKLNNEKYGGNK